MKLKSQASDLQNPGVKKLFSPQTECRDWVNLRARRSTWGSLQCFWGQTNSFLTPNSAVGHPRASTDRLGWLARVHDCRFSTKLICRSEAWLFKKVKNHDFLGFDPVDIESNRLGPMAQGALYCWIIMFMMSINNLKRYFYARIIFSNHWRPCETNKNHEFSLILTYFDHFWWNSCFFVFLTKN